MTSHVFVSYSRNDSEPVDQIVTRLDQDQFDVWIDRKEIHGGDLWREEIVEAIDEAYAFVLMLSPASVASDNVRKEVDLAEGADKALVPLLLSPVKLSSRLRYQLAGIQWIEYYRDSDAKYRELVDVLRSHRPKEEDRETISPRAVEFVLKGLNLSQFSPEKQEQLLDLIADFTGTPRAHIRMEELTPGSVHVFVNMPARAAYQIKTAALNRNAHLIDFGIDELRLSGDRSFVELKRGRIAPPRSGNSSWFISGLILFFALFLASVFMRNGIPLTVVTPTTTSTFTFTPSQIPSRTPTPMKTSTPTPTVTSAPDLWTITGVEIANCRTGPSKVYDVYSNLFPGQTVQAFGRNDLNTWFLSENPKEGYRYQCWISIGPQVKINGDTSLLPVVWDWPDPSVEKPGSKPPGSAIPLELFRYLNRSLYCQVPHTCQNGGTWSSNRCACLGPPG